MMILSYDDFKIIKDVYVYHPLFNNIAGKEELAELYKSFGMTIFHDMYPRAHKAKVLEARLDKVQNELRTIKEEIDNLSM